MHAGPAGVCIRALAERHTEVSTGTTEKDLEKHFGVLSRVDKEPFEGKACMRAGHISRRSICGSTCRSTLAHSGSSAGVDHSFSRTQH